MTTFPETIDVLVIGESLVELVLVGAMGSLDLPVQLWRTWLDVDVFHAEIGDMPVEERLELVAAVGPNGSNTEWELLDPIVDEVDRIGLGVALVDFQCANPRRIVDRRLLRAPDRPTSFSL